MNILATDLDDTFVGDDQATARLSSVLEQNKDTLRLVYVTGRSFESYLQLKQEYDLRTPDATITHIGTEIFTNGVKDTSWPKAPNWNREEIALILKQLPSLESQPKSEQRYYKVSYFVDDKPDIVSKISTLLEDYSVDISYSMNHCLDILPKGVNKGSALEFLATGWSVSLENIYTSGDSGNDISMMKNTNAIAVGNSKDELINWAKSDGKHVYIAENSYADGIVEGLEHYGLV